MKTRHERLTSTFVCGCPLVYHERFLVLAGYGVIWYSDTSPWQIVGNDFDLARVAWGEAFALCFVVSDVYIFKWHLKTTCEGLNAFMSDLQNRKQTRGLGPSIRLLSWPKIWTRLLVPGIQLLSWSFHYIESVCIVSWLRKPWLYDITRRCSFDNAQSILNQAWNGNMLVAQSRWVLQLYRLLLFDWKYVGVTTDIGNAPYKNQSVLYVDNFWNSHVLNHICWIHQYGKLLGWAGRYSWWWRGSHSCYRKRPSKGRDTWNGLASSVNLKRRGLN